MKILQINTNWGRGGPGGVLKDLYYTLTQDGNDCVVAYGRFDIPKDVQSIKIGTKFDQYLHAASTRIFDNTGFMSQKNTKELINKIQDYYPDIIHLHSLVGYYINVEVLFSYLKLSNIPVVWTLHDCWAFTGHCINFERAECDRWRTGCFSCPQKKNYPYAYFFDNSKNNYEKKKKLFSGLKNMVIVAPSKWLKTLVSESFLKEYPILTIPNGIDLEAFRYIESDIKKQYDIENKKIILAVASIWNEMKGEQFIYELAEKISSVYKIVMIGKKNEKKTPSAIISIPNTQNVQELVEWYSVADVFVNPTLGDNLPTVNIEALACGTPVVTFNTGGSPEIAGNECGRVVYTKTADELYKKIVECLEQNISRDACCERAKKYDRRTCAKQYRELFEKTSMNR